MIHHALESIVNDSAYIAPLLLHILTGDSPTEVPDLSKHEIDAIDLVCEGLGNRGIRSRLQNAEVKTSQHIQVIIHKRHVRNQAPSAAEAIRNHLADLGFNKNSKQNHLSNSNYSQT